MEKTSISFLANGIFLRSPRIKDYIIILEVVDGNGK